MTRLHLVAGRSGLGLTSITKTDKPELTAKTTTPTRELNPPPQAPQDLSGAKRNVLELLAKADIRVGGDRPWDIQVHDEAFYGRVLSDPTLQLGETYMDGMWDSAQIDGVTTRLMSNQVRKELTDPKLLARTPLKIANALFMNSFRYVRDAITNRQTRTRSTTVAEEHYDAGNELYRRMLDPTMTYTSGVFAPGYTLEDAQNAKYDLLCRKLDLKPGDRVLDIGCGFGGFARFAAKHYGAEVVGITISVEQLKAARALSSEVEGVEFHYSDYRDIHHRFGDNAFDHVVSIEMIEAVGHKNLNDYFNAAQASLKEGGRFAIQAIAENVDKVNSNPWFSKYIFHDGVAPSRNQVDRGAAPYFGPPSDVHRITSDYDKTLKAWNAQFQEAWPDLQAEYGDRFKRMWEFYLLSVAGGFRSETMQLDQVVYTKGDAPKSTPVQEPVRELPSLDRVRSMRASDSDIQRTKETIAELEAQKLQAAAKAQKVGEREPLSKDERICIMGAGPSGLTVAKELKEMGFTNVTVLEQSDTVGGKSHTRNIGGRSHDLGATMGVGFKYDGVAQYAAEAGVKTVPFPKQVHYSLDSGAPEKPKTWGEWGRHVMEALRYTIHNTRLGGLEGLEVPPDELADPLPVVMKRKGFQEFGKSIDTWVTGYGYGDGETTPAVFGYRMLDMRAIAGGGAKKTLMWKDGTTPIWSGVAKDLNVELNAPIRSVVRGEDEVQVYVGEEKAPRVFDRLVVAADPKIAMNVLDATPEEQALFSKIKHMPYSTFACRVKGISEGKAEVSYIRENMTMDRVGHPMAWIKRYDDDDVFVFHLFAPKSMSDEEVMAKITADMKKLGATDVSLEDSRRWDFFPHVDSDTIRVDNFYERALAQQGEKRTVYANELMSMSTMADTVRYGKKVAARLASGEWA